jgi:outer membrane protein assembly factor BamB
MPAIVLAIQLTSVAFGQDSKPQAADWPQWRGLHRDNVSTETAWRTTWPEEGPKQLWRVNVAGGESSVAVVQGRVYTTGHKGRMERDRSKIGLYAYCLDAETGRENWKQRLSGGNGSHSTPTVKSGAVYIFSNGGSLFCLDADTGDVRWSKSAKEELGAIRVGYHYASSPLVTSKLIIAPLRLKSQPDKAAITAFNKDNGKLVWQSFHIANSLGGYWSSPVFSEIDGKPTVVYLTGRAVAGIHIENGRTLWEYIFQEENDFPFAETGAIASTPVVWSSDVIFQYHPGHRPGLNFTGCLHIEGGKPKLKWRADPLKNWVDSCTAWKGNLYAVTGRFHCVDLKSGTVKWSRRSLAGERTTPATMPRGVFTIADGKLIVLNRRGWLSVVDIRPDEPRKLAATKLFDGGTSTAPVLAGGRIFCRNTMDGELVCLDVREN